VLQFLWGGPKITPGKLECVPSALDACREIDIGWYRAGNNKWVGGLFPVGSKLGQKKNKRVTFDLTT